MITVIVEKHWKAEAEQQGIPAEVIRRVSAGMTGSQKHSRFEDHSDCDVILLRLFHEGTLYTVVFCLRRDCLLAVVPGKYLQERLRRVAAQEEKAGLSEMLCLWLRNLTDYDYQALDDIEQDITDLEDAVIARDRTDCTRDIVHKRRLLLGYKRYYEQFLAVCEGLEENENGLMSERALRLARMLSRRAERLLQSTNNLRDYVAQVREAAQAQVDIDLNNIMKLFTVITAIFLPLTLIAGWYGMNLQMPEYHWKYGYLAVIVGSVVVVAAVMVWFRRKKWF